MDAASGLRPLLRFLQQRYDVPLMVTTGWSSFSDGLDDGDRVDYLQYHVDEVLKGRCFSE